MKDTAHLKGFGRLATLLIAQNVKPSQAFRFASFVEKLIATRGPKGAMLYLDSLGDLISEETIGYKPKTESPTWVRRQHVAFFKRPKNRYLLLRATKIKRHIVSSHLTPSQVKKFIDSVCRPPVDDVAFHLASLFTQRGMETISQYLPRTRTHRPKPAINAYVKRELSKGVPPKDAFERALDRIHEDIVSLEHLGYFADSEIAQMIYNALDPLNRIEVDRLRLAPLKSKRKTKRYTIGTIHCTQEPGLKARFFAAPQLLIQCCLEPLKVYFMKTLQAIPNDACFNHSGVISTIQDWLQSGRTVWSLDQQDATNRSPAKQQHICIAVTPLAGSPLARLFRFVSEELWDVSPDLVPGLGHEVLQWTVGQPLGTGPSFGAYSVAHHAMVRGLCAHLGLPFDCYFILGDDFVTCEEELAVNYRSLLEKLGVPISEAKSIISDRIAEFAGFTILPSEAYRPGRWREVNEDSLLSFVTDPGFDYKRVVPKFWCPLIERMRQTPYPFGLYRPNLWEWMDEPLEVFGKTVCIAIMKTMMPSEPPGPFDWDSLDFEFFSDKYLEREFFRSSSIIHRIYEVQSGEEKNKMLLRALAREKDLAQIRYLWSSTTVSNEDLRFVGTHASVCRRQVFLLQDALVLDERQQRVASTLGLRTYSDEDIAKILDFLRSVPKPVFSELENLCVLIQSICSSCSALSVDSLGGEDSVLALWLDSVPFFQKKYSTAIVAPGPLDLIRDAIEGFPYYSLSDFGKAPSRFTAVLRRYARHKDLVPSLRTPLPRKRVV